MRAPQQGARNSQPPVAMMRGEQRGDEQKERNEQRFVCAEGKSHATNWTSSPACERLYIHNNQEQSSPQVFFFS